jgi:hypothetical protein
VFLSYDVLDERVLTSWLMQAQSQRASVSQALVAHELIGVETDSHAKELTA